MKFDSIDKTIAPKLQDLANAKLNGISLELGTRENNHHVGSGLGGNSAQLIALMSFHHKLVNDPISIEVDRGLMRWGREWLEQSSRKDIRSELDIKVPIAKYTPLDQVTNDPRYYLGPNVSSWKILFFAEDLCKKLAVELDNGDESNVQVTALALFGFPQETILMAVRRYIQIDRLVRHNLDEHPDFGNILTKINNSVDN